MSPAMRKSLLIALLASFSYTNVGTAKMAREEPMPVAQFNRQVADAHRHGDSWTLRARSVAIKFLGTTCCPGERCDCQTRVVKERNTSGPASKMITITDQGIPDDSIRGYRYHISLTKLSRGFWQLSRALRSWNCWPGRGHQDFSIERCT